MADSLTFVIPAFNAAGTLGETLRSLSAQTRGDWSAVVVDDGSRDATGEVARSWGDARVRVVRQENRGLAGARNRGLEEADGEMVCFLDADDAVDPEFAEVMTRAAEGHDLAACGWRMVGARLEDLGWTIHPGDHDLRAERLVQYNPLAVGAVVMRRSCPGRVGVRGELFDTSLPVHEDWDCWLRLTAAGARWAPAVHRALFLYRTQAGSMSGDLRKMHRVGLEVIVRAPVAESLKPGAARRWTVRSLARAVARGDAGLAGELGAALGGLGSLSAEDTGVLAGSLKWAFGQEHRVGPREAPGRQEEWRARARSMLGGVARVEELVARLDWRAVQWDRVAAAALEAAGERGVVVVYGVGRNGRALLGELARWPGRAVAWIDDHPAASAPEIGGRTWARVRVDHLTERHLVVVTPDDRGGILERLGAAGRARVVTPEELLGEGAGAGGSRARRG